MTKKTEAKKAAPPATTGESVIGSASHRCVSVVGNAKRTGASIDIWDCGSLAGQSWTPGADGTFRTLGMCMTASGTSDGAAITLEPCNGSADQTFRLNASQDLVRSGTNRCVDVTDGATHDGTHLQLWKCDGTSNQKWYNG
ncbi:ricin-type beta-trefoil lectin domain protein [Streptomyces sp. NPDC054765]